MWRNASEPHRFTNILRPILSPVLLSISSLPSSADLSSSPAALWACPQPNGLFLSSSSSSSSSFSVPARLS